MQNQVLVRSCEIATEKLRAITCFFPSDFWSVCFGKLFWVNSDLVCNKTCFHFIYWDPLCCFAYWKHYSLRLMGESVMLCFCEHTSSSLVLYFCDQNAAFLCSVCSSKTFCCCALFLRPELILSLALFSQPKLYSVVCLVWSPSSVVLCSVYRD